jgi:CIC family chloride channel protein
MIAAATGALVSEIVLDETVLLNFNSNRFSITIKSFLYPSRILTVLCRYIIRYFQRTEHYFLKLKLNAYKSTLGTSILAVLIFILTFW